MRNKNDEERRRLKIEFAYRHREWIGKHIDKSYTANWPEAEVIEFIKTTVRTEIPYSPKTADVDIWIELRNTYKKIIQ